MFKLRDTLPTDDEIRRQNIIIRVVFGRANPLTSLEKKAAAVIGRSSADPLIVAKTLKNLPEILSFVNSDADLLEINVRNRINELVKSTRLSYADPVWLPAKPPVFVSPNALTVADSTPRPFPDVGVSAISRVSLQDFETFAFNSKILYKYYKNTSFASYLFQNLIYSQNLVNSKKLDTLWDDESRNWQSRLASLLYVTNANEQVATDAFYSDVVVYGEVSYNVDFVPSYDVRSIQPLSKIVPSATEQEMINYYYSFDPSKVKIVPKRYIGIFLSFPFRAGYHIRPDGTVLFSNLPTIDRHSIASTFTRVCDITDIEAAIENIARRVTLNDALSYAAYAKTLTAQGIALMVVRRIVSNDIVYVPSIQTKLHLDDEYNMLSWMTFSCKRGQILLPVWYKSPTGDKNIALVRDIARSCRTKLGATVICSTYYISEVDINYVYTYLTNDAERYVLYTLVLQQYANAAYFAARNALRPKFGTATVDLSAYTVSERSSAPMLAHEDYQNAMFEDPLIVPASCFDDDCMDNYEFTDPQLRQLTLDDDVELTERQLSEYIASYLIT